MEDTDLTKKAIEELLREMDVYKEKESLPTERKKNPLGKPNKRFLGRTINSMMSHNKRQSDRNHQRCQRKLQEMDDKQKKHDFRNHYRRRHSKAESSHEIISSDSDVKVDNHKKTKKLKKKKKKRRKKKQRSSSSSTTSSSSSSCSSSSSSSETESSNSSNSSQQSRFKNRKKKKHKKQLKEELYEENYDEYYNEPATGYYVDPNMAYAAMAYSQMNHIMQQQQLVQQQMVKEELEENIEIPSDLSLSCHSESSLNISLNSSSAEEDENGILTFKLESSEDEIKTNTKITNKNDLKVTTNQEIHIEVEDSDKESIQSHISLESGASNRSATKERNNEICLLSSSDSEDLEIVETIQENKTENLSKENEIHLAENLVEEQKENNVSENPVEKQEEDNLAEKAMQEQQEINKVDNENIENNNTTKETDNIHEPKENDKYPNENMKTVEETPLNVAMVDLTND